MKEYIEREALVKHLNARLNCATRAMGGCSDYVFGFSDGFERVQDFPAADVVERKRGEWVEKKRWATGKWSKWLECSKCGHQDHNLDMYEDMPFVGPYNFCPNCGADMRGEKHEGIFD